MKSIGGSRQVKGRMKSFTIILAVLISISLCGCQKVTSDNQFPETQDQDSFENAEAVEDHESAAEPVISETSENIKVTGQTANVAQGGPYGEISLALPVGWKADTCTMDSDDLYNGMYGIRFYPEGVTEGYIELVYVDSFGVCGTGLEEEETTIAGVPAWIGTYDDHVYPSFISFQEDYEGIVAFTYSVADWWGEYEKQILTILDTLSFDQSVKEGAAYVFDRESEVDQIGLQFSLKNISRTGATLVFDQFDVKASTGELVYSDDFVIEIQKDGTWEEVPVVLDGEYGFHSIAYLITSGESVESELSWEWLYGELAPGEYRIGKSVLNSRDSGDFDLYMVYAHFILN